MGPNLIPAIPNPPKNPAELGQMRKRMIGSVEGRGAATEVMVRGLKEHLSD